MRILDGILAGMLWLTFLAFVTAKSGAEMTPDLQWFTLAIIVAGAMAGGD